MTISGMSASHSEITESVQNRLVVSDSAPYAEVRETPETVCAGESYTYHVSYGQAGDLDLSSVNVSISLPDELSFVSALDGGAYDAVARRVTRAVGTVESQSSGRYLITVMAR